MAQIPAYTGASSDSKPTNVGEQSRYLETDTGRTYTFIAGNWVPQTAQPVTDDTIGAAILSELRKIRFGLERWLNDEFVDPDA